VLGGAVALSTAHSRRGEGETPPAQGRRLHPPCLSPPMPLRGVGGSPSCRPPVGKHRAKGHAGQAGTLLVPDTTLQQSTARRHEDTGTCTPMKPSTSLKPGRARPLAAGPQSRTSWRTGGCFLQEGVIAASTRETLQDDK